MTRRELAGGTKSFASAFVSLLEQIHYVTGVRTQPSIDTELSAHQSALESVLLSWPATLCAKEGYPIRVYNVAVDHSRRILLVIDHSHPGARNDEALVRFDDLIVGMKNDELYANVESEAQRADGSTKTIKGLDALLDGGYHTRRCLMCPGKMARQHDLQRCSKRRESIRKDLKCSSESLKRRSRLLGLPIVFGSAHSLDMIFKMRCAYALFTLCPQCGHTQHCFLLGICHRFVACCTACSWSTMVRLRSARTRWTGQMQIWRQMNALARAEHFLLLCGRPACAKNRECPAVHLRIFLFRCGSARALFRMGLRTCVCTHGAPRVPGENICAACLIAGVRSCANLRWRALARVVRMSYTVHKHTRFLRASVVACVRRWLRACVRAHACSLSTCQPVVPLGVPRIVAFNDRSLSEGRDAQGWAPGLLISTCTRLLS
eukprot:6185860-Pleurochrysis_carterae.AAC.2